MVNSEPTFSMESAAAEGLEDYTYHKRLGRVGHYSSDDSIYNFDDVVQQGEMGDQMLNEQENQDNWETRRRDDTQSNYSHYAQDNGKGKRPNMIKRIGPKSKVSAAGSPTDQEPTSEHTELINKQETISNRSEGEEAPCQVSEGKTEVVGEEEEEGSAVGPSRSGSTPSVNVIHVQGVTRTASTCDGESEVPKEDGRHPMVAVGPGDEKRVRIDRGSKSNSMEEEEGSMSNGGDELPQKRNLLDTQADLMPLATLITNPGMKRAESMEIINASLHQLARDGDETTMRRWLASLKGNVKKKVNAHDDLGLSPLHYAARYNHVGAVQALIEYGADTNDVDAEGGTPLHFAARYKRMRLNAQSPTGDDIDGLSQSDDLDPDKSVIIYLVNKGGHVNAKDIYGCTPLHFAAMRGNEVASKQLLSCRGCNIEAIDKQSMTALHLAASHDEAEIVRMLIERGANLQCEDEERGIPLHFACMEGSLEVVNMILEAAVQKDGWVTVSQMMAAQDNQDNTPLHLAVENRSLDVAKVCLEKGADVNMTRNNYMTPLHLAAVSGELEIVKLLIQHNARVDALDIQQQTPLHCAAEYDHSDVVEYLLDQGAKINRHDKDNYSPLLLAAVEGNPSTLGTLLRRGANLYDTDKSDKTALFLSAEQDQMEALKILLSHPKAKGLLDVTDRYDNTPLHIAAQNGYLNIVKELINAGADMDFKNEEDRTPIHVAAQKGKTGVVRELVRRNKAVVNHEDEDSNTALHLAALAGHNKVVRELIEAGADIEARNTTLWTPLDCAAAKGWPKTVRTLLEADAPVDPMDKSKTTPLHLACRGGHVPVVTILLEWNANVRQRDADGNNCLDLAVDSGNKEVAMAIANSNHWREALMNETLDLNSGLRNTPMRKLIRKMPDVAERIFSHCTTSDINNPDHPDYSIKFNYEFLDDMYANWREDGMSDSVSLSEAVYDDEHNLLPGVKPYSSDSGVLRKNHPLMIMVKANQEDLLAHPLVTSLLRQKWNNFGRYVYYTNLAFYCVFLFFLSGYLLASTPPYMYDEAIKNVMPNVTGLSECEKIRFVFVDNMHPAVRLIFIVIGKYLVLGLSAFAILREIFQIYKSRWHYIGWENTIEWIVYVMSVLLVIDFDACQQATGIRTNWQWQLGAIAIFLAWIDLVLFMRKLPRFGIYVVMFTDILRTFISFFPVFFLFIIAFAFSFAVLFKNQYEFASVGRSLIKTSVMMIGEFEFQGLFFGLEENPGEFSHKVFYQEVSYIIFVAFLIIMSILIMNLLVGLAVDDIKAVQESAVLKRLAMQVELVLEVESVIPQWIRRKIVRRYQTIYPNRRRGCFRSCPEFDSATLSSSAITRALNPELLHDVTGREYELAGQPAKAGTSHVEYELVLAKSDTDELEQLQETQDEMKTQIYQLRGRMKTMSQNQETMTNMLTALLKHHNVEWQDEDFQQEDS